MLTHCTQVLYVRKGSPLSDRLLNFTATIPYSDDTIQHVVKNVCEPLGYFPASPSEYGYVGGVDMHTVTHHGHTRPSPHTHTHTNTVTRIFTTDAHCGMDWSETTTAHCPMCCLITHWGGLIPFGHNPRCIEKNGRVLAAAWTSARGCLGTSGYFNGDGKIMRITHGGPR